MAAAPTPDQNLFAARPPERTPVSPLPWIVAGAVVLIVIAGLLILGHRKPASPLNVQLPPDPYASSLTIGGIEMSESTSLSGGKSTYIDGHIHNNGPRTVTAVIVQAIFANDEALPPQIETLPLTLIRTHQPYVDTQPISDAPIAPGDDREFRLIFETIGSNWNTQPPQLRAVHVTSH
jgi:Protein of unknown function (DUF2393)